MTRKQNSSFRTLIMALVVAMATMFLGGTSEAAMATSAKVNQTAGQAAIGIAYNGKFEPIYDFESFFNGIQKVTFVAVADEATAQMLIETAAGMSDNNRKYSAKLMTSEKQVPQVALQTFDKAFGNATFYVVKTDVTRPQVKKNNVMYGIAGAALLARILK